MESGGTGEGERSRRRRCTRSLLMPSVGRCAGGAPEPLIVVPGLLAQAVGRVLGRRLEVLLTIDALRIVLVGKNLEFHRLEFSAMAKFEIL